MSKTELIDIVVIGSGPGGYAAAFRAADLGQKVMMVDRDTVSYTHLTLPTTPYV